MLLFPSPLSPPSPSHPRHHQYGFLERLHNSFKCKYQIVHFLRRRAGWSLRLGFDVLSRRWLFPPEQRRLTAAAASGPFWSHLTLRDIRRVCTRHCSGLVGAVLHDGLQNFTLITPGRPHGATERLQMSPFRGRPRLYRLSEPLRAGALSLFFSFFFWMAVSVHSLAQFSIELPLE